MRGKRSAIRRTFDEMSAGTRWAYVGNVQGIGASIALNASEAASRGHGAGPVIVAGSVPVFLYVALEILARKKITGWKRLITYPGFVTVVAVTFVTSYQDQAARLTTWGFDPLSAAILPIGIDGLMVVAAVALVWDATPFWRIVLWVLAGVFFTFAAGLFFLRRFRE